MRGNDVGPVVNDSVSATGLVLEFWRGVCDDRTQSKRASFSIRHSGNNCQELETAMICTRKQNIAALENTTIVCCYSSFRLRNVQIFVHLE